jgi:dTDP-4-amino-4,6-dideoxygalactose transaminase
MKPVPFLKPKLVEADDYLHYLRAIEGSRVYSNFGPLCVEFERRICAEHFDGSGAVTTVSNATIGLMLAFSAAKRAGGRFAIMPSFTFAATPQAAVWCGLEPYFVDIREDDWCANEALVADVVGRLRDQVALVVPYATFGTACDLTFYRNLHASGVPVVVDAAASFGTRTVSGQFGKDFPGTVVFSFHATKAFGIGEGGLVYSGDTAPIERIRQASNFGFSSARESMFQGLNGKLSEYTAAVGLATLDRFSGKIERRQTIHRSYLSSFERRGLLPGAFRIQATTGSIPHQFMGVLCPEGRRNTEYIASLLREGIEARTYFAPACHQQPFFIGSPATPLTVTESTSERILNLPLWEDMDLADIERVTGALELA